MSETASTDADGVTTPAGDPETLLDALRDADSRSLIAATSEEARTAKELADRCGLSLSATYRRLERLTAAGLLVEGTRVEAGRRPAAEYARDFDGVLIDVTQDGRLDVTAEVGAPAASD
jgi:DNA-binding Lrp family transcriptional regulator